MQPAHEYESVSSDEDDNLTVIKDLKKDRCRSNKLLIAMVAIVSVSLILNMIMGYQHLIASKGRAHSGHSKYGKNASACHDSHC